MARSVFTDIRHSGRRSTKKILTEDGIGPVEKIRSAVISVTVIYSYLAIEAFVNYHLYDIWKASIKSHNAFEKNPQLYKTHKPLYDEFYKKYGHYRKFEKLKDTQLGDLGTRIKEICNSFKIRKISDSNNKLWNEFKELQKEMRNFLIHPFPNPIKFQNTMKTLLYEKNTKNYVQIAQDIIKHFFTEKGQALPEWVEKNKLFRIKCFEYIG